MYRCMRNTVVFWVCIMVFFGLLPHTGTAASAGAMKAVKSAHKSAETAPKDPLKGLTDAEIDALLNRLIESMIRQTVDRKAVHDQDATKSPAPKRRILVRMFLVAEGFMSRLHAQLDAFLSDASESPDDLPQLSNRLTGGRGFPAFLRMAFGVIFLILFGAFSEWLVRRWTADMRETLANIPPSGRVRKAWRVILNLSLDTASALVFILSSFILFDLFFEKEGTTYLFTACYLLGSYYVRGIILFMTLIFSPHNPLLRFFPVSNTGARYLFRWTVFISITAIFLGATSSMIQLVDADTPLHIIIYNLAGLSVVFLLAVMVIQCRKPFADVIRKYYFSPEREPSPTPGKACEAMVCAGAPLSALHRRILGNRNIERCGRPGQPADPELSQRAVFHGSRLLVPAALPHRL